MQMKNTPGGGRRGFLCCDISFMFTVWCRPEASSGAIGARRADPRAMVFLGWVLRIAPPAPALATLLQLVDLDKSSECERWHLSVPAIAALPRSSFENPLGIYCTHLQMGDQCSGSTLCCPAWRSWGWKGAGVPRSISQAWGHGHLMEATRDLGKKPSVFQDWRFQEERAGALSTRSSSPSRAQDGSPARAELPAPEPRGVSARWMGKRHRSPFLPQRNNWTAQKQTACG